MACTPAAQREMTLREINAHLSAIAPEPADERAALMAQHPGLRGRS
ncbi:hypothetical protein [Salinispora pacifica]|nr:hypothetical protein [Salinispora pacifica]